MSLNRDVLWYKDAIVFKSTSHLPRQQWDGIGDFQGLEEKLDYLQQLGITRYGSCHSSLAAARRWLRHRGFTTLSIPAMETLEDSASSWGLPRRGSGSLSKWC